MSIIKHNQLIQNALNFLIEAHKSRPSISIVELIDEASMRFNLTPLDAMHLTKIFSPQLIQNNNTTQKI
ncbi:hypothetical protein K9U34_03970 [Lawsonia intracellularis]|uniref:hypothetical protein n=1 Tax=Lawsonia intracellularis TaxID=29546 RepID=UPI00031E0C87|nr:hypothetical protein [Lawsonia intracellularis]KAA0204329.1 hypothetical protein C4K43_04930 [Lawsonia intracellularis]MBZ3892751.1 hypothetical protein [Lawsonia intracellularis]OMQ03023.1 hypothetical protein BW722_04770 [Lawsonia intracellularis]RBN33086.1 hypothetical protein DR194_01455 [Lawsonia intracellularis]RBN35092.1 hypothetical protein DR192_01800 [Lawsonia intracellularis]